MKDPFTTADIATWYKSKQTALSGSDVAMVKILETASQKSTAVADFEVANAFGQITGNVAGEFDFHALRISDGQDLFWRHVDAIELSQLEEAFAELIRALRAA